MKRNILLAVVVLAIAGCGQLCKPAPGLNSRQTAEEVVVEGKPAVGSEQAPVITLGGYYRDGDGRVRDRLFPVELKLQADGRFTGTYEEWIQKRFDNGQSSLVYRTETLSGSWTKSGNTLQITLNPAVRLRSLVFQKANGLHVIVLNNR